MLDKFIFTHDLSIPVEMTHGKKFILGSLTTKMSILVGLKYFIDVLHSCFLLKYSLISNSFLFEVEASVLPSINLSFVKDGIRF